MLTRFVQLGDSIAERIRPDVTGSGYSFTEVAVEELSKSLLLQTVNPQDVINDLFNSQDLPQQDTYEFGEPAVIVYTHPQFYIQVLFWTDGTTSIHMHSFAGAFGVLSGSSVHARYAFNEQSASFPGLLVGKTQFLSAELLSQGDIRPIETGGSTHALFHLDRPSVSIVIRTPGEAGMPQYNYAKPFLAVDPLYSPALPIIQLRMLECLFQTNRHSFWGSVERLVQNCEPWTLYKVMSLVFDRLNLRDLDWERFYALCQRKDEVLAGKILKCLHSQACERRLLALRSTIHDPQHRFFLALLLNVPTKCTIYDMITKRFPSSDPESLVLRWLGEIFREKKAGLKLTPLSLQLLRLATQDHDFIRSRPSWQRYLSSADPVGDERRLKDVWKGLQAIDILQPLFTVAESSVASVA